MSTSQYSNFNKGLSSLSPMKLGKGPSMQVRQEFLNHTFELGFDSSGGAKSAKPEPSKQEITAFVSNAVTNNTNNEMIKQKAER